MTRQTDSWWANNWLKVVAVGIALMFIVPVIFNYWMAPMIFEQNRDAGEDIAEDQMQGEVALEEYRWFRTQWHDIQAQRAQTENYREEDEQFHETYGDDPSEWSRTAETRHGRIHERITGSENQVEQMVAEYNARSDDATRAIFQCGLPYNIDKKLYIADGSGVEYTSEEAADMEAPEDPTECQYAEPPESDE